MSEIITVHEYFGNNFSASRQAIYKDGILEYLPEPDPPEEEEEEEQLCMKS